MRELYDEWLDSGTQTVTPAGNVRAPSRTEICDMVSKAWNSIPETMIAKSFQDCGQTIDAKPEEITCVKSGKCGEAALPELLKFWNNSAEEFVDKAVQDLEDPDCEQDIFVIDSDDEDDGN